MKVKDIVNLGELPSSTYVSVPTRATPWRERWELSQICPGHLFTQFFYQMHNKKMFDLENQMKVNVTEYNFHNLTIVRWLMSNG